MLAVRQISSGFLEECGSWGDLTCCNVSGGLEGGFTEFPILGTSTPIRWEIDRLVYHEGIREE